MPQREQRPYVGLMPTIPTKEAGGRMDPPVSVPVAAMAQRAATAAAEPPLDPPGTSLRVHCHSCTGRGWRIAAVISARKPASVSAASRWTRTPGLQGLITGPKWLVTLD